MSKKEDIPLSKIGSLLIHAAKIDEHYSIEEEEIIKKTLISLGAKLKIFLIYKRLQKKREKFKSNIRIY